MPNLFSQSRLYKFLTRTARDQRGVSAVAFAISFAVLTPMALGVFDVYQSTEQRGKLQDALDAAALYAARSDAYTTADINTVGQKALAANLQLIHGATLTSSNFTLNGTEVDASAQVALPAYAPMEYTHQPVSVNSTVQRAMDRLEVALVLDNTGSMAGTKITTLQTDAKQLIDTLVASAAKSTDPNPLKISLVPFSQTVRVMGTTVLTGSNYNAASHTGPGIPSWIDPQGKAHAALGSSYDTFTTQTDRLALLQAMPQPWAGCVEQRTAPYDIQETAPDSTVPATLFVPYFWTDELGNGTSTSGSLNDYANDVGGSSVRLKQQSNLKYNGITLRNGQFTSGYNYGPNAGCSLQPMMRLTNNTAALKTAIDGMTAVGDTNIPLGLMWGWHTLSPNAPLADGSAYGTPHLRKVIIMMTDGANTFTTRNDGTGSGNNNGSFYSGAGYVWQQLVSAVPGLTSSSSDSTRSAAMDARMAQLCTNIKAKNIYIYTIRVEVTSGSSALLQNCATTADDFYDVTNVANLNAAFNAIAGSIANLRISH
jgi:Flp pilus assembly protein TadG